jgi:PEP-CTERM motif
MKKQTTILSILSFTLFVPFSNGASLLIDMFAGSDPTSSTDWTNAGVTEDLTGAAGGTFTTFGLFNISGGIGFSQNVDGGFSAPTFSNTMLNGYWYKNGGASANLTITGLADGLGVPNLLTGGLGSMTGTFAIAPSQQYKLYLFGAGDTNGQNTTFTFEGVDKTTNPTIVGTSANDNHFVTYDFTTPSDLTGYQLSIDFKNPGTSSGAFNGLAIIQIPEPSAVLLGGLGVLGLIRRRR